MQKITILELRLENKKMENEQLKLWEDLREDNSLKEIQKYIREIIRIRGFANESAEQKMLMLIEEVGEVAKAIRKDKARMGIDKNKISNYDTIESEIADVFIVLVSLCNILDIDLFTAVKDKERENIDRQWK